MEHDHAFDLLNLLGDRFIALGQAIRDTDTPITELARMGLELGLTLQVRFVPLTAQIPNGFAGIPPVSATTVNSESKHE